MFVNDSVRDDNGALFPLYHNFLHFPQHPSFIFRGLFVKSLKDKRDIIKNHILPMFLPPVEPKNFAEASAARLHVVIPGLYHTTPVIITVLCSVFATGYQAASRHCLLGAQL